MERIAMSAMPVLTGGGTLGAVAVFALVFMALSWLGPVSLPLAAAPTGGGRAIARVWGYALT